MRMDHGKKHRAAVRLIKGEYIVEQHNLGLPIRQRQELPESAFHDGPIGAGSGVDLIAVSYPWLRNGHPDPNRFHLSTLAPLLPAYHRSYDRKTVFFLDFMSLYQGERTAEHDELFKLGLRAINLIYGQQHVKVWCLTRMPPDLDVPAVGVRLSSLSQVLSSVASVSLTLAGSRSRRRPSATFSRRSNGPARRAAGHR